MSGSRRKRLIDAGKAAPTVSCYPDAASEPSRHIDTWDRPAPVVEDITKAFSLYVPLEAVRSRPTALTPPVYWVPTPPDRKVIRLLLLLAPSHRKELMVRLKHDL
jgi:hypothetical protein